MSDPIRKTITSLQAGQDALEEALAEFRAGEGCTVLAVALKKAPAELAPDIILAAACMVAGAALQEVGDPAARRVLTDLVLVLEGMGGDLDAWHRNRAQRWERRA